MNSVSKLSENQKAKIESLKAELRKFYDAAVKVDEGNYESGDAIDQQNKCFEILEDQFGWNFEADERSLNYITNATDLEIAEYLWDHVFIDIILHEEARDLMEELDAIWGMAECSLDEYKIQMKKSGDLIMPSEDEAINYILIQWDEKIINNK
jgi:hypothetical protein